MSIALPCFSTESHEVVVMLPQGVTHPRVLELLLECGGANVAGT